MEDKNYMNVQLYKLKTDASPNNKSTETKYGDAGF